MTEGDQQVVSDERLERIARLRERRARGSADDVTGSGPSSIQSDSTIRSDRASTPATSAPRRRRGHPARDSRIVAAGLGAGAMFGIVTLLGLNTPTTQADTPDPETPAPSSLPTARLAEPAVAPQVRIVIHRVEPTASSADPAELPARPIELTAKPVVRTVTVAAPASSGTRAATAAPAPQPAPTATTSGSN